MSTSKEEVIGYNRSKFPLTVTRKIDTLLKYHNFKGILFLWKKQGKYGIIFQRKRNYLQVS